jgi:GH35 family endo-1,4-beta-xylanase
VNSNPRRSARLLGEHEVLIGPSAGGCEALRDQAHPLAAERGNRGLGQLYRQMLGACLAAPNCRALIVFGVYDGDSGAKDLRFPTYAAPLLFDEAFRPKPAYEALAEVLRRR